MSPLLPTVLDQSPVKKCTVTRGHLPRYIDSAQPPTKRKPIATLGHLQWCHQVDVLLPTELTQTVLTHLSQEIGGSDGAVVGIRYAKVQMKLEEVLIGEFFNSYIKSETIAMRSEGCLGTDSVYGLRHGVLTLHLPSHTYQRTGLSGKPRYMGGLKHQKSYFEVSFDLRQPNMVHGKPGFERIVWAARHVLNESRTWVFAEVPVRVQGKKRTADGGIKEPDGQSQSAPIEKFHPLWRTTTVEEISMEHVSVPKILTRNIWQLQPPDPSKKGRGGTTALNHYEMEDFEAVSEYLSLLALNSSRVNADDKVDPYICQYDVPNSMSSTDREQDRQEGRVTRLSWKGFMPTDVLPLPLIMTLKKVLEQRSVNAGIPHGNDAAESGATDVIDWAAVVMHGIEGEIDALLLRNGDCRVSKGPDVAPQKSMAEEVKISGKEDPPEPSSASSIASSSTGLPENGKHVHAKPRLKHEGNNIAFIEWFHER